jgi:Histidine kinase
MHQRTFSPSAATSVPVRAVPRVQPTRGPPPGHGRAPDSGRPAGDAEAIVYLADDHERIALGLNDVVVHRLFAASLDLQAALGLLGEHRATDKIHHAVDELDQAVRDIRAAIFGYLTGERPPR